MKKRTVLLIGLLGCLMFTTIQGCGQPAEEETVSLVEETVSESIEESTVSEETTASEEETIEETEESLVEETIPIETETTTEETEVPTETETIEEVSITEMDATMYATTGVNVRESYSSESNKLRTVGIGEAVHVTGQTADGSWYRIEDTEAGEGFISAQYLSTEKPVIQEPSSSVNNDSATNNQEQPLQQGTVPVDSLTEAQQKVVDQINQGQQQTGGTPVDNGGSAEADALLGGPPTAATSSWLNQPAGDLDISNGKGTGILHAE